jgi:hypothetical protein
MNWEPLYHDFLTNQYSDHFPAVKSFKQKLFYADNPYGRRYQEPVGVPAQEGYGGEEFSRRQTFAPINYGQYGRTYGQNGRRQGEKCCIQ